MPTHPAPLYDPARVAPAFALRYSWSAWCADHRPFPPQTPGLIAALVPAWEADGLRVLETHLKKDLVQILFSTTPIIAPIFIGARAKGRLDHAFRQASLPVSFSRKLAVRSIGANSRDAVQHYVSQQVAKENYCDPRWAALLQELLIENPKVNLSQPRESARGRYWNCLHIVLVTEERQPIEDAATLRTIRDACLKIAAKKDCMISRLAVLPDHLHLALSAPPEMSPAEVVGAFQNNLAFVLGQRRVWRDTYYAGTLGDYDMQAVRRVAAGRAGGG